MRAAAEAATAREAEEKTAAEKEAKEKAAAEAAAKQAAAEAAAREVGEKATAREAEEKAAAAAKEAAAAKAAEVRAAAEAATRAAKVNAAAVEERSGIDSVLAELGASCDEEFDGASGSTGNHAPMELMAARPVQQLSEYDPLFGLPPFALDPQCDITFLLNHIRLGEFVTPMYDMDFEYVSDLNGLDVQSDVNEIAKELEMTFGQR